MSKQTLPILIGRSRFLTDERKKQLMQMVPSLEDHQTEKLEDVLSSEAEMTDAMTTRVVTTLIEKNDTAGMAELDKTLKSSEKKLRGIDEESERTDESHTLTHFFDEAA